MESLSTYEDMLREFGDGSKTSTSQLSKEAIIERGGCCINCSRARKIDALRPHYLPAPLRQENLSVQVSCSIDPHRKYPFRGDGLNTEDCPSMKRHLRRKPNQGSN